MIYDIISCRIYILSRKEKVISLFVKNKNKEIKKIMALIYTKNILDELKKVGYTSFRIRQEKLLSESTIQHLRASRPLSWNSINMICKLLKCQPGDFIKYIPDE